MSTPDPNSLDRTIVITAHDRGGRLLPGATIEISVNGTPGFGAEGTKAGTAVLQLSDPTAVVEVSASYDNEKKGPIKLAQNQTSYAFEFDVDAGGKGFMERHLPLAVGLVLLLISLVLAFAVGNPNSLQTRLVLATSSLGGGAIATEIPGMLNVNVSLGTKIVIGATGALGVFIVLFLIKPPM
jgi:hypothetical protein